MPFFYAGVGEARNIESKSGESPTTFFTLDANCSVQIAPDGHGSEYRLKAACSPLPTQDSDILAHMGEDATSTSSRFRLRADVIGKTL